MPWKLISYLFTLVVIVTFIGLNLENKADIDLWFNGNLRFENVPVFISLFVAYILGALSVIPYWIRKNFFSSKLKKTKEKENVSGSDSFKISTTSSESTTPHNDTQE